MFPVLFHVGKFPVHTYGVVLMLAFLVGLGRAYLVAKRRADPTVKPDDVLDLGIWIIVFGVIGARLLFVLLGWSQYRAAADFPVNIFKIWQGGLSFHGGLLGGILVSLVFCHVKRMPVLKIADIAGPCVMVAYAIGRMGCLLNGCCYGAPTTLPWGIRFYDDNHWTPPSHPTQLYSTLLSLFFFAILVMIERRRAYLGQVACWYLLFAATERFVMEIWRAGTTSDVIRVGPIDFLTDVQWLCVGIFALGLLGMMILRRLPQVVSPNKKLAGATG